MYGQKRIMAVIPARGRNDGIPHMNMRELGGKPLIEYTIQVALQNPHIDLLMVSTEDLETAKFVRKFDLDVPYLRPLALSTDDVDMTDILQDAVSWYAQKDQYFDYVMALYPNAPFKTSDHITAALETIISQDADMCIPLYGKQNFFWEVQQGHARLLSDSERHSRKQSKKKYEERGGVYIYRTDVLHIKDIEKLNIVFCEFDHIHSIMINSTYDLYIYDRLINLPRNLLNDMFKHS